MRGEMKTTYDPKSNPCFPILTESFNGINDLRSNKGEETKIKRLQITTIEVKLEVNIKFQGLNPHRIFPLPR